MLGRFVRRSFVTVLFACVWVGCLAGWASADEVRPVTIRPGGAITATSLGSIVFDSGAGVRISCRLVVTGTIVSGTMNAQLAVKLGSASRVTSSECSGGSLTPLAEASRPWEFIVHETTGTFPESLNGIALWLTVRALATDGFSASCLYDGKLGARLALTSRGSSVYTTGLVTLIPEEWEYLSITRLSGFIACPTRPTVTGSFSMTSQTATAAPAFRDILTMENGRIQFTDDGSHTYRFRNESERDRGPLAPTTLQNGNLGFRVTTDGCNGATLSVNSSCEVTVTYTRANGREPLADVLLASDARFILGSGWVKAAV